MVHSIWLLCLTIFGLIVSCEKKLAPLEIVKPRAGQVWVYNPAAGHKLKVQVSPHSAPNDLPHRVRVIVKSDSVFGGTIFMKEYETIKFFPRPKDKEPPFIHIEFPKGEFPSQVSEGYYKIVIKSVADNRQLGQSKAFRILNGLPSHGSKIVSGFHMSMKQSVYKLRLNRQLKSGEEIKIYAVNAFKNSFDGSFLDHSHYVSLDKETTDKCFQEGAGVCIVPMPIFDFKSGIYFEVYVTGGWMQMYRSRLELRTRIFYKHFQQETVDAIKSKGASFAKGCAKTAKGVGEICWHTGGAVVNLLKYAAMNPTATLYTVGGVGLLAASDYVMGGIENFISDNSWWMDLIGL